MYCNYWESVQKQIDYSLLSSVVNLARFRSLFAHRKFYSGLQRKCLSLHNTQVTVTRINSRGLGAILHLR